MKKLLLVGVGVLLGVIGTNLIGVKELHAAEETRSSPVSWPIGMQCQIRLRDNVRNGPPTEMSKVQFKGLNGDWIVVRSSPSGTTWYPKDAILSITFQGAVNAQEKP